MKRIFAGLAAAAVLTMTTAALADSATGTIKAINVVNRMVTLDDGKVYVFTAVTDLTKVKVGDKVKVTFVPATPIAASSLGIFGSATTLAPAN
jgi:uncharacterized OB-fold protein